VNVMLHLTDDTQLRAHGFVAQSGLFAEVHWDFPLAGTEPVNISETPGRVVY
jgi:hypothetical protein